MSADSSPPSALDFFEIAADLGLLSREGAAAARREWSGSRVVGPSQFVAQRGLLDPVAIDIVETLAAPTETVPGYRILGVIGRGGMGVVYRAEQRTLGRTVALKTILVSRMADQGVVDRFAVEARTVGQLRHPNIIAAHDFGRHAGRLFLAMELVEGTDLDAKIRSDGPLDEATVWGLARQTAAGLCHAAEQRVVHRDIKPANLMLVTPLAGYPLPPGLPMVKIADFGLALLQVDPDGQTRLTADNATLGSPHYMAPEQLESSLVDLRADIYSLGATVYHALAGRAPFAGLNLSQLIAAKLSGGPVDLASLRPDLSPGALRLVARLMSRQPAGRPQTYAELLREIDDVLAQRSAPVAIRLETAAAAPRKSTAADGAVTDLFPTAPTEIGGDSNGRPARSAKAGRVAFWGLGIGLLAVLLVSGWRAVDQERAAAPDTPAAAWEQSGDATYLFNGRDTTGWRIEYGNWVGIPETSQLSGTDGVISRLVPPRSVRGTSPRRPLEWYRLDLVLDPLDAADADAAQEVHFGLQAGAEEIAPRMVVRRTAAGLSLGSRLADRQSFVASSDSPPRAFAAAEPLAVSLRRIPEGWQVLVNAERFASVELRPVERPEFRLLAEGTVRFSEISITELHSRGGGP